MHLHTVVGNTVKQKRSLSHQSTDQNLQVLLHSLMFALAAPV